MTDIETQEEQAPDYSVMTAGISFSSAEILGKAIETDDEALAFRNLVDKFFGSEFIFEQLKVFVGQHWEKALEDVHIPVSNIIAPSSNG